LSSFSQFNKLEVLLLGNEKEKSFYSGYGGSNKRRVSGSFKILKELINLKRLLVRNCDITGGLEYLPKKLEHFDYSDCDWVEEQLKNYSGQVKNWKENQTYYKLYQGIRDKEVKPLQQKLTQEENSLKREKEINTNLQQQN